MTTYSADHSDQITSFFSGHDTTVNDVKIIKETKIEQAKAEKPFISAAESIAVEYFDIGESHFEGMSKLTVDVVAITSAVLVTNMAGFILGTLVLLLATLIAGWTGLVWLGMIIYVGGLFSILFNRNRLGTFLLPTIKVVVTSYAAVHRKVKSFFVSSSK
jgi:hypothetical protein